MGKNLLKLDTRGFDEYIAKLEDLNAAVPKIVEDACPKKWKQSLYI